MEPADRCYQGGPLYGFPQHPTDLRGDGRTGAHYGSGLSAIGGSLRSGELTGPNPVRHALKIELWGSRYYYRGTPSVPAGVPAGFGYRWPATNADGAAKNEITNGGYGGTNPQLAQGSLLAIRPGETEASVGVTTAVGKKLFHALQDYGAYVVDDTAWQPIALSGSDVVEAEVQQTYGESLTGGFQGKWTAISLDIMKLVRKLHVVTNNTPTTIGGGGTPRAPLAPPFTGTVSQVSAPVFNPAPGTYTGAQNVTITSATTDATIRYTTDNTTPTTTTGIVYANPVNIAANTTLKAIAYKSGLTNSNVTTGTYTINTGPAGIVGDPGFENQTSNTVSAPWALEGRGGIDRNLNPRSSRSGLNNGWTGWQNGWNALIQRVPVAQNSNYTLTGYVQTSSTVIDGYFGVRNSNNSVLKEVKYGTMTAYTPLTVSFNSGTNTSVIVFAGHWINNVGAWMHLDDVSLTAASTTTLVHGTVYRVSPKIIRTSALEVLGFKTFDGDSFCGIWQYVAGSNQKWKAYSVGNGFWEFEPQHELGARLDVRGGSSLSQTDVWSWTRNGGKAQRWKPIPNSDGSLSLEPECAPGTRLDVKAAATANGTRVWIYTNNGHDAQRWFFQAP
jgi:hypothetical protein